MVVVLPAPFGPRNPTISPFPTVKDKSWMIVLAPYRFQTDSRATTAGGVLMTGGETARGGPLRPPPRGDGGDDRLFIPAAALLRLLVQVLSHEEGRILGVANRLQPAD